ncbi:hypothetical protein GCG54_00005046 [Colletotrichum gloeosporioides]|uniref:Uncharacterized protein n=1 Tax=Colletotrichum gloeosporioides TaxID=474922 RepID=A0A8H4FLU9_COLGL|nr:uncharacterized protein GCG54_00005046 [Colletotrichum gloeosporioides]KAF3805684.1 hypothetical protein GCG54_00005046 [Colletotrichum gloeosporioides]
MGSISDICDRQDGFDYHNLDPLIHEVEIVIPRGLAFREHVSASRDGFPGWTCDYEQGSVWGCNPHLVEVVDMRDNRRVDELLSLHIAWPTGGCAWCVVAEGRLLASQGGDGNDQGVGVVGQTPKGRTARLPSLDSIRQSALPKLVPTVRFVFQFPGCSPPGITMDRVNALRGECSDMCHITNGFPPGWSNFPGQEVQRA